MKEIRRLFLIINPISGTGSKKGLAERLVRQLEKYGFEVRAEYTKAAGHASELARQAVAEGYDGVLACGGDGTINETARAMIGTDVPMGIIPNGSGNGLARHIAIPIDVIESLKVINERYVRDCDYGEVNGHPFFCTFGIGFDAAVSERFASSGSRGKMTYIRSALHEFRHYKSRHYLIEADGEVIDMDAYLITVANAGQYGNNAYIAPDASITDGYLDLVIVPNVSHLGTLPLGFGLMSGTLATNKKLVKRRVSKLVITREDGPAHLDGEPFCEAGSRIEITCHPGQLKLFCTKNKKPFKPFLTPARSTANGIGLTIKHIFKK